MQRTMKLYRLPDVSEQKKPPSIHPYPYPHFKKERKKERKESINTLSSLPQAPKTQGLRPMTKKDVPVVHRLLREYLSQFSLVPSMNQEEVEHWLLPRENIIDTYLVEVTPALCCGCVRLVHPSPLPHCRHVFPVPTERREGD